MWHVSSRSGVATLRTAIHLLLTYLLTMLCNGYVTETRKLMSDPSADYTRLRQIPPDCRRLNSHRPTRHDKAVLSRCELALRTKPKNRKNNGKTKKKQVSVRRLSAESLIYLTDNDRLRDNSKSTRELHRRSQLNVDKTELLGAVSRHDPAMDFYIIAPII